MCSALRFPAPVSPSCEVHRLGFAAASVADESLPTPPPALSGNSRILRRARPEADTMFATMTLWLPNCRYRGRLRECWIVHLSI